MFIIESYFIAFFISNDCNSIKMENISVKKIRKMRKHFIKKYNNNINMKEETHKIDPLKFIILFEKKY